MLGTWSALPHPTTNCRGTQSGECEGRGGCLTANCEVQEAADEGQQNDTDTTVRSGQHPEQGVQQKTEQNGLLHWSH